MTLANYQIPISALSNPDTFREQINAILAEIKLAQPSFGASLPAVALPSGRLFVVTPANDLYQARGGAWVAL